MTDEYLESTEYLVTGRAIWIADSERDAELAALRERAAGLEDKVSSLIYDIRCAVAHSNRTWCVEHTKKHLPMLLAALAAPADAEGDDDAG